MKKSTKLTSYGITTAWLVVTGFNNLLAADRHVPADYPTIQAAVNAAASGDTIHIAPGVYVAQTWITNKNLTLIGQPGTILRAFPGMAPAIAGVDEQRCILHINQSSNVIVRGLSFEGDQLASQNAPALFGVNFDLSGGRVENCRFSGFREKTPGSVEGLAIYFWNAYPGASRYEANVSGTTIVDSYSGISIQGPSDVISYDVSVVDNTITGVGLTTAGDYLQGLNLGDGTVGTVARNTISGFAYNGQVGAGFHTIPFGILRLSSGFPGNTLALEPMTFEDNVLRSNQVHLAFFKADDSVVRNNTFDGNLALIGTPPPRLGAAAGLWFSGTDVQVTGNLFRNLEQGIRLSGLMEYDPFGITTNAMLIGNRFCDVTTQVYSESGAGSTQEGSLTCPFPNPVLNIAPLSSPGVQQGLSVQSAPTPTDPSTTLAAAPIRQDGQSSVAAPAAGEQQFFRLAKP